jgi:hypothetical protein
MVAHTGFIPGRPPLSTHIQNCRQEGAIAGPFVHCRSRMCTPIAVSSAVTFRHWPVVQVTRDRGESNSMHCVRHMSCLYARLAYSQVKRTCAVAAYRPYSSTLRSESWSTRPARCQPSGHTGVEMASQPLHPLLASPLEPLAVGAGSHAECCGDILLVPALLLQLPGAPPPSLTSVEWDRLGAHAVSGAAP